MVKFTADLQIEFGYGFQFFKKNQQVNREMSDVTENNSHPIDTKSSCICEIVFCVK